MNTKNVSGLTETKVQSTVPRCEATKWFTIIADKPEGDLRPRLEKCRNFTRNSARQWVLWDGPANRNDILNMANALFPYFGRLDVFVGKRIGRCIFTEGQCLKSKHASREYRSTFNPKTTPQLNREEHTHEHSN